MLEAPIVKPINADVFEWIVKTQVLQKDDCGNPKSEKKALHQASTISYMGRIQHKLSIFGHKVSHVVL